MATNAMTAAEIKIEIHRKQPGLRKANRIKGTDRTVVALHVRGARGIFWLHARPAQDIRI